MAKASPSKTVEKTDVGLTGPQLRVPDAESTAELVLTQALEFCAQKLGLAGRSAAIERLREEDGSACGYCRYSIAKQVAESLGSLDDNVKSAYIADYDATPQDVCYASAASLLPIHLIVWVERKTSALDVLIEGLDRALSRRFAEMIGPENLAHLMDVQVVDDGEVEGRRGYGALLTSMHNRPIKVWER